MTERVRVLRLIEYTGDREWVERTVSRSIKGTLIVNESKGQMIRAVSLGDFAEILGTLGSSDVKTSEEWGHELNKGKGGETEQPKPS